MINRNENGEISVGAPGSPARLASERPRGLIEVEEVVDHVNFRPVGDASRIILQAHIGQAGQLPAALHMVACWNALEGWNPVYVRELLEASRKMIRDHMTPTEWTELSKLLTKAEGKAE